MTIDESALKTLVRVFLEENKKLNLSAFRSEEHCWVGNVLDSISLLQAFEHIRGLSMPKRLIDIGTGGGFPLVPLGICLKETTCIGIDSTQKKVDAVSRIIMTMHLKNVRVQAGRVEELAHQEEYRETADLVTARALAPIPVLLEYAVPLLKVGGFCAFWKSSKVADELQSSATAQKLLGVSFAGTFEYELPGNFLAVPSSVVRSGGWGKRLILFFRKNKATLKDYPRQVGMPKAKPL